MNYWLKSSGTLHVGNDVVRIAVSSDFGKYYQSLIDKEVRLFTGLPAHGSHITIYRNKLHGKIPEHKLEFLKKQYYKKRISFEYNIDIIEGGAFKKFKNWYMKVRSSELDDIVSFLDIKQDFHITVCNTKSGVRPYIWLK
jgi:hypothetical protein